MKTAHEAAAAITRLIILLEKPRVTMDERWMAVAILKNVRYYLERLALKRDDLEGMS